MQIQDYLNNRVENQLSYYSAKSKLNKTLYYRYKTAQMLAAALLPFISAFITEFDWTKYLVAFLGTVVTVMEGILSIGKYHEQWVTYRTTAERLRQEKFLFLMETGIYSEADAKQQFVNKIEMLLGSETTGWQQIVIKDADKKLTGNKQATATPDSGQTGATPTAISNLSNATTPLPTNPITGIASEPENDGTSYKTH